MSEKTKRGKQNEEIKVEDKTENSRNEEAEKRSYYYDDAHGYEIYNPEDEDEKKD